LGHRGEAVGRVLGFHGVNPHKRRIATFLLRNKWVAAVCGFADRGIYTSSGRPVSLPHTTAIKHDAVEVGCIMPDSALVSISRAAKPYR
jgi:hypothetical protein